VASGVTLLVGVVVAAPLTECISDSTGDANPQICGVYSGTPCGEGTLIPYNGVGCLGTVCPSGQVCGGRGGTDFPADTFSCLPGALSCGLEVFTLACTTDTDCPGLATCSSGICYGTACPGGQVCSGLDLEATCGPPPDGGTGDAGADASPEAAAPADAMPSNDPQSCGVFSAPPCGAGTLVPASANGCLGTMCPSGEVCGGRGGPDVPTESFSCSPGALACGLEEFTSFCTSDSDCDGMATCSEGTCYGTACPGGQVCSGLSLQATCQPVPEGGTADACCDAAP